MAPYLAKPALPTTDVDVSAADDLLPDVADFDPTSAWGAGDEVTTAVPGGPDFDPTSLGLAWGDGDDATAAGELVWLRTRLLVSPSM